MDILNSISTTPPNNFHKTLPKIKRYKQTISIFDKLQEEGYHPADMGLDMITMRKYDFRKLVKESGNKVCFSKVKGFKLYTLWINYVEISYMEESDNTDSIVIEDWV